MRVELEACKLFYDSCEEFLFKNLPEKAKEYSEDPEMFVFETVKKFFSGALGKRIKDVVGRVEPPKLVKAFFNFFDIMGKKYEYKILSERPLAVEISNCPQRKYSKDPLTCLACLGSVAGALETAYGSVLVVAMGREFGDPNAKVVLKKEGEPGRCKWIVEER